MNLKLSAAGFAIQTAKGAPKAQPDFWAPVGGGALVTLGVEQTEDELTSAEVGGIGEFRQSVAVAADYETRAWPASIGGLLYAVLGAIESSGGAPAVKAVYTTALAGVNNDLTFLAKTAGVAGNGITVALVNGGSSQPLTVGVVASAITVNLATGSGGAITSTATQVKNAINAKTEAKALITASVAPGNSGAGVVTALAPTNLAGGAAAAGGGTYTHVITAASELPWATVFGAKDTERKSSLDSKCDELKIEWEAQRPAQGQRHLGRLRRRLVRRRLRPGPRRVPARLLQGHPPRRRRRSTSTAPATTAAPRCSAARSTSSATSRPTPSPASCSRAA